MIWIRSKDESLLSVFEKVAVISAVLWALYTFAFQKNYSAKQASVQINQIITDHEFMASLNNILEHEYDFRCNNKLDWTQIDKSKAREFFVQLNKEDDDSIDKAFLIVTSRIDVAARCANEGVCDKDFLLSIFPLPVIQSFEYLLPYMQYQDAEGMTWSMGENFMKFIEEYRLRQPSRSVWAPHDYKGLCSE